MNCFCNQMQKEEHERVQYDLLKPFFEDLVEEGIEINSLIQKLSDSKADFLAIKVAIDLLILYLEDLKDEKDVSLPLDTSILGVFDVIKEV